MNLDHVAGLEKSMKVHGQLQPVIARIHEGGIQLIDGFKRLYAAETLLMDSLECRLFEVDEAQAKIMLMSYNWTNQSMEVWEEAMVLKKLTGHSRSWVSRRLSLISKVDEEVAAEIRMGAITSRHARALMRLPRGNQVEVARVISNFHLSSRLSERLVTAFLEAEDAEDQRQVLAHPEPILWDQYDLPEHPYDERLSSYGNDLMESTMNLLHPIYSLLQRLGNPQIEGLNEIEKVIITPFLQEVSGYAERLSKATMRIQIHKQAEHDER